MGGRGSSMMMGGTVSLPCESPTKPTMPRGGARRSRLFSRLRAWWWWWWSGCLEGGDGVNPVRMHGERGAWKLREADGLLRMSATYN